MTDTKETETGASVKSQGAQRVKRNGVAWIALAAVIALVLVGGIAGAAAGYRSGVRR